MDGGNTKTRKANILNLERAQFSGVGKYDIPEIQPVYQLPEVTDWIPFDFMLSDKRSPEEKQKTGSDAQMKQRGVENIPLCFLAKSLENMSLCHAAFFCEGWENARGCKIEHEAAVAYGLDIIYENEEA